MSKFRVKVYGELDDDGVQEAFADLPGGVRLIGVPEGTWQVEFAVEADDEKAALEAAEQVAEALKFDLGQWHGIDPVKFA